MPYRNPQDRIAQQRRYAQTQEGRAARARSHRAYTERRRMLREASQPIQPDAKPLTQAIAHWRN